MKNIVSISATSTELETLENIYSLFALFDEKSFHVLFAPIFKKNIEKYKNIMKTFFESNNIFFSCKSNKSETLLRISADTGCGIEVSSVYELQDALKYTNKIISSGPAKSDEYLNLSIDNDVIISIDDVEEIKNITKINKKAKVFLRISNLLGKVSRFGINKKQIEESLKLIKNSKIELIGLSFHINNYSLEDRINAIKECIEINKEYQMNIKYIDIGGGIPTTYCSKEDYDEFNKKLNKNMFFNNKKITSFYPYYNEISDELALKYILENVQKELEEIEIIIEPGRSLLSKCGITIFDVAYTKELESGDNIIITNGNINSLSEQWFNSDYLVNPVLIKKNKSKKENYIASVAGNLCLENDMITWRKIEFDFKPKRGDSLVYFNTAGYQMDSNESTFHKIPVLNKYIVYEENNELKIMGDVEYANSK